LSKIKKERITKIVEGEKLFLSKGISRVKITRFNEVEDTQEVVCLEIPIQSTGISELIDTFKAQAPVPHVVDKLIKKDSQEAKELGLDKSQWVKMFDYADKDYIANKEKHDSDLGIAVLCKGIAVDIFDKDNNPVTSREDTIRIMREKGMSGEQFSQMVENITSLTRWSEQEKSDFLE